MFQILPRTFYPSHEQNLMANEGDTALARKTFLTKPRNVLKLLLHHRFDWMNAYLKPGDNIMELGAGAGFSRLFIHEKITQTDVVQHEWIDQVVDANALHLPPESVDAFILSHMIHHVAHPVRFMEELHTILKPGGYLIISEINTSFFMRLLLRIMRHEGWSYEANVFDRDEACNNPEDPWSANCAIPQMLWQDDERFAKEVPGFRVVRNKTHECLLFPLSGGVISKAKFIPNFPMWFARLIHQKDRFLVWLSPRTFACGRQVVLQKV